MNFSTQTLFSKLHVMPEEGIHRSDDGNYVCVLHVDLDTVKLAIDANLSFGAQKATHNTVRLLFSFGNSITAHALATVECSLESEFFTAFINQNTLYYAILYRLDGIPYFGFTASFKPDPAIIADIQAMHSPTYITHHTVNLSSIALDALATGIFYSYTVKGDARKEMLHQLDSFAFSHTSCTLWFAPSEQHTCVFSSQQLTNLQSIGTIESVYEKTAVPFGFTDGEGTVILCALDKQGLTQCAEKGNKKHYESLYPLWN